ncbi:E3 ubiquitin-protein ligase UPL1 [Linum grandiflorum]
MVARHIADIFSCAGVFCQLHIAFISKLVIPGPVTSSTRFSNCGPAFTASIISLITHIYSGVGDIKTSRSGAAGSANQRFILPPPDEATIATIVEMGFSRSRAEEALRRVDANSVEMAMEWLFTHAEDPVQEDDELARALALSLGSSSEGSKNDNVDKSVDVLTEVPIKMPSVDDILAASVKLFQSNDAMVFSFIDLLATLCNRNKGEDRPKVASYLCEQLKLCPLEFSKDSSALYMISHILAVILHEDGIMREISAQNGIVCTVINILTDFKAKSSTGCEILSPKCIGALLLILDCMLQSKPRNPQDTIEGNLKGSTLDSPNPDKTLSSDVSGKESDTVYERILGKSTGYMTMEDSQKALLIACDLIKQHVPAFIMQAVLQLCARLTKTHALALQFLENGGLAAIFSLPRSCFFPGYDTVVSAIVRHLLEDPQSLQTAMELEIRQTFSGNRHGGRIPPRTFLTSMAPVISRDPVVFMKAATAVCRLESSGGRTVVILSNEKDREKEKSKVSGGEESLRISEAKIHDSSVKCIKGHKKIPLNLTQVIEQLLDIVLNYPLSERQNEVLGESNSMEIDVSASTMKGKSKVDETRKVQSEAERSAALAKVTFVLKLLSDILLMYLHAVGVILRRDAELCQLRPFNEIDNPNHGGIIYHVLHRLLPVSTDKFAGSDEWRDKLSEKASWFLVVLCGRSSEGRRRVINELVKAMASISNMGNTSNKSSLLPDKVMFAFADLVYSVLSKNASSSTLPGSGCSPDIAKSMIDGGVVHCLTGILQMIDLDHPDTPKTVNLLLKSLESLTRAANSSRQIQKIEDLHKKGTISSNGRLDQATSHAVDTAGLNPDTSATLEVPGVVEAEELLPHGTTEVGGSGDALANQPGEQSMRIEMVEGTNPSLEMRMDFMHGEMEGGGVLRNGDQIEMTFRVENRTHDDMGNEDDDMADEGEDNEDDDDDGDDEDEDVAEDGGGMMSLADTDVEDHDETGLGDAYNDDMMDEEDDDYHENRVIEVRWREALDGLDRLQVLGQPGGGSGLIDVAAEPFDGVNVDDLFGLRRPLGIERRHPGGRSSFDRSVSQVDGFQHPLLSRPSQSTDLPSNWSSGGHLSRDLEALSAGSSDVSQYYMFDAPVLPYDHASNSLFGDRLGSAAPPPLTDYSVGMDSSHLQGRRGLGDGRWTDYGQLPAGAQASVIAQAVEEQFLSQLDSVDPTPGGSAEREPQNMEMQENQPSIAPQPNDGQVVSEGNRQSEVPQQEASGADHQFNPVTTENIHFEGQANDHSSAEEENNVEPLQVQEGMVDQTFSQSNTHNVDDRMEIGEGDIMTGDPAQHYPLLQHEGGQESPSNIQILPVQTLDHDGSSRADFHDQIFSGSFSGRPSLDDTSDDVDMNSAGEQSLPVPEHAVDNQSSIQATVIAPDVNQTDQNSEAPGVNAIDPTFLEALPEDLRAEVLASRQVQSVPPPVYAPPSVDDIDPEFLAALPPEIQAEVLAQQRAQRITQQAEGQPVDMDNASIIATFPADLREEVLLTSPEAVLSALPSPLLAEAQMLRDRAMSHYQARSLFGSSHRLSVRRNGLVFDRQTVMDRSVGVSIGRRATSAIVDSMKVKEIEGEPLLDANALMALIRLLRLAQPLGKGLLQRLLLNLCAHSSTRATLVRLLVDMIKPEAEGSLSGLAKINSQRLYGCQSNVVYGRSQLLDGLPPLVVCRILEVFTYLATNHSSIANMLFYLDPSVVPDSLRVNSSKSVLDKGKGKVEDGGGDTDDVPLILFLKLLDRPLFFRSTAHLEQVMGLLQVVVYAAASNLESQSQLGHVTDDSRKLTSGEVTGDVQTDNQLEQESKQEDTTVAAESSISNGKKSNDTLGVFMRLPRSDLRNLSSLLGREGLSDKVYMLSGEVLRKLASVSVSLCKFFMSELSDLAHGLSSSAVCELVTLRKTNMLGLGSGSMAGAAILRVLQALSSLTAPTEGNKSNGDQEQESVWNLNTALEPLWHELSECISVTEMHLGQGTLNQTLLGTNLRDHVPGSVTSSPLPPGNQRLLPFIEAFFVLCEKLQANNSSGQQDQADSTAKEVKELGAGNSITMACGGDSQRKLDGVVTFSRFAEKHRRLLNAFIRQNPGLLEKSLSMMLKAPRLIDFDNKRAYFRSRIRQQHEQHLSGPLRISVRRAYVLEDSYNQLRMRPTPDLRGRLNVQFQGEEGIDAGGLTREWYQILSRVIFDKGALLFTTVGNNATFQPNPNSVYQTEHLSYFRFVGRVVAKALFDGQLLDVYFTRSFYKHILGVKVTYHDIEAVDPDYYKNLKWMLENDVSDIPDLTFSMDPDEEKQILYEKNEVTDYELKPGGRNIRVTEETKHEYVDLVADHILTNAIRPQINSFLDGFNELIPRNLISIFNDKELELLISGLPEIDLEDLKANTEYTGYTAASSVVQWFWEVVKDFNKEDMARLVQFITGTSKVPLEGFKALQGISGPQRFQVHKAYGAPERLPSAHTCFNQLDLPEYTSKEHLRNRLLLAIHEASEGFGFG